MENTAPVPSVKYPKLPIEDSYKSRGFLGVVFSRHNFGLLLLLIVLAFFAGYLSYLDLNGDLFRRFMPNLPEGREVGLIIAQGEVFGAIFVTWLTASLAIFWKMKDRISTVNSFSGEIFTIVRLFLISDVVLKFIHFYSAAAELDEDEPFAGREKMLRPTTLSVDHYQIYHLRSEELGSLNSDVVHQISEFYTILKFVQHDMEDIVNLIRTNDISNGRIKKRVLGLMYSIDILMISAGNALDSLLWSSSEKGSARQITVYIGEMANKFFREHMIEIDPKDNKLDMSIRRAEKYKAVTRKLPKGLLASEP